MTKRDAFRRGDLREQTRRDLKRRARRAPASRFFRALGLLGSVGWPIVILATGGALLGRVLDARFHSGIHATLSLLVLGTALGTAIAYRSVRRGGDE